MTLFADFLGSLCLMFGMGLVGLCLLGRWAAASGTAAPLARAAGKGIARKVLEAVFKKH